MDLTPLHVETARRWAQTFCRRLPEIADKEAIEGAGLMGLAEAASRFDPSKGVPFGAFAYRRVVGAMRDEVRSQSKCRNAHRIEVFCLEETEPIDIALVGSPSHCQVIDFQMAAKKLSARDRFVILMRARGFTQYEISILLGVSESRICQIEKKIKRGIAA